MGASSTASASTATRAASPGPRSTRSVGGSKLRRPDGQTHSDGVVLTTVGSDANGPTVGDSSAMRAQLARGVVIVLGFASLSLAGYARFAPLSAPETQLQLPGTVVLDVHGNVLERDGGSGMRIPVGLGSVAPRMLQATISAEDRRFQQHPGVDPLAIARAAITSGSQPSGASTITQQLARRLYLADDASPLAVRKAHEALVALQLERSEEHTSELQSQSNLVCRLLL